MKPTLLLIFSFIGAILPAKEPVLTLFYQLSKTFQRQYETPAEQAYRLKVFRENYGLVGTKMGNLKAWEAGLNQFFDLSEEEFNRWYTLPEASLYRKSLSLSRGRNMEKESRKLLNVGGLLDSESIGDSSLNRFLQLTDPLGDVPRQVSFRRFSTSIKDQQKCSACYAFAALAGVELWTSIVHGAKVSLSEQEIIDCSTEDQHCIGGQMSNTLAYIIDNGVSYSQTYPYIGKRGDRCSINPVSPRYRRLVDFGFFPDNIVSLIRMAAKGPVVVAHAASQQFKFYKKGVFTGEGCPGIRKANHSAIIIGYNLDAPIPYFELKNSWSEQWGESGYYQLAIGPIGWSQKGLCLIAETPFNVVPLVK